MHSDRDKAERHLFLQLTSLFLIFEFNSIITIDSESEAGRHMRGDRHKQCGAGAETKERGNNEKGQQIQFFSMTGIQID